MTIQIYQGNDLRLLDSDINVVIDVVRAFTVTHYAFMRGADKILLAASVDEAFALKKKFPAYLLAGEINGLPIDHFELDNSPSNIVMEDLEKKSIIQKTTNGVKAALHSLNTGTLLVTGLSNARATASYILLLAEKRVVNSVNLIASHPSSDEDMACADYIKSILLQKEGKLDKVQHRIRNSDAVKKFFDPAYPAFKPVDIDFCTKSLESEFVMRVTYEDVPTIRKEIV